jgi:hypothetical protein
MSNDAIRAALNPLGGLDVNEINPFNLSVNMGRIPGYSVIDKFGENPEVDTNTAPEDIWEGGGLYNYDADGTAPIERVVSNNVADTGIVIPVEGLDIDGNYVSQDVTLTGTTPVLLGTPLWRCFRMGHDSSTAVTGVVYAYVGTVAPTAVPPATADPQTRAIINNGNNQTLMALYTIPKGKVGFLFRGELGVSRQQTAGEARLAYFSRRLGKVFTVKKRVNLSNTGTSIYQDKRSFPDTIPSFTDIRLSVETVSQNGMGLWGAFDIMLVDETQFPTSYLQAIGQPGY